MNISLNNYEIWFIDYADGKLSAQQKQELFRFLKNNPHLKEEFEQFENVSLKKENIVFEEKESLKRSTLEITGKNCEDYFIAYHEHLLSPADKKAVEDFVMTYPGVKKDFEAYGKVYFGKKKEEFDEKEYIKTVHSSITDNNRHWWMISAVEHTLTASEQKIFEQACVENDSFRAEYEQYKKTLLSTQEVVFTDKESLKRKDGKVIPLFVRYASYAAAACLLLFFGWKALVPGNETTYAQNAITTAKLILPDGKKEISPVENNFIAEEKKKTVPGIIRQKNPVPVNEKLSPVNNSMAINDAPVEKTNKKIKPFISPAVSAKDIVRINPQPTDSLNDNVAENKNPTVTEMAFNEIREDYLTPKEFLVQQFNKKVLNKNTIENPTTEELASVASVKVSEATNVPVNYSAGQKEDYVTKGFSIGRFGFSRTKRVR